MPIKLYGYWRSSASYRVRIALNLKSLDYENIPVSLKPGVSEQRKAPFREINPQMRVPFFVDDRISIGQSMAILDYLEERYPDTPLLPSSEPERSQVRAFANLIACDIHPLQNLRVMQYVGSNFGADIPVWAAHWMREGFSALEQLCSDGPFVYGDTPTLADVLLVPQVYNARRFNVSFDEFPKLASIADHCLTLAAFKDASPENQPDAEG